MNTYKTRGIRFYRVTGVLLALAVLVLTVDAEAQQKEPDVIYVPTPDTVVEKMMEMANVQKGDYVIDLGSGDGRIVIAAAKHGAYAHGVEIDPERLREARANAEESGVQDRISFIEGDLFETDFSRANVIMMYLLRSLNLKLRPDLLDELEPGTPIVSHSFNMGDWEADQYAEVEGDEIYLWYVPADVKGTWKWKVDGQSVQASFRQKFQEVDITLQSGASGFSTRDVNLKGKRVSFITESGNTRHVYSGKVEGGTIKGIVQIHEDGEKKVENWTAQRQ